MSQTRRAILFVDDEVNILNGLRRMLRDMRNEWDMVFVPSPFEALEYLSHNPVDAVVSDMRMPGMDGAELLTRVRELYPTTIRIVLSGFADREAVIRTIGPSHQYLSKPCDPATLTVAIRRSLALRELLSGDGLRAVVAGLRHLPSPPKMFREIMQELDAENASAASLAVKIRGDVAISAQILKLTNSAYFSLPSKINDIETAISMLGFDTIKALFLFSGIFARFAGAPAVLSSLERVSQRSLKQSALAKRIAETEGWPDLLINQTACAGLLCHVGTILLLANAPDAFCEVGAIVDKGHTKVDRAEEHQFGASHATLGAYLLGLWGFNDLIVEAVAYHHHPGVGGTRELVPLTIIHVTQALGHIETEPGYLAEGLLTDLDRDYLESVGAWDKLPAWTAIAQSMAEEWRQQAA
jgi:HD-like signal output (HDOD) protein/CheY-like chemotaxis protein